MIPMIMDDTKTLQQLVSDTSNGLGRLPETISSKVKEVRNGEYVAEVEVPIDAKHYGLIHKGGLLKLKPNQYADDQLFRIDNIHRSKESKTAVLNCNHISYDMMKVVVLPFSATGITNTLQGLKSHLLYEGYPFDFDTNITNTTSAFSLRTPVQLRSAIGGMEGSLLDIYSGANNYCEIEWDNLDTYFWEHRGTNRGIQIKYGKNLIDDEQEESVTDVYDGVIGYAEVDEVVYTGNPYLVNEVSNPYVLSVDFSDKYESDTIPTTAELTAYAQSYAISNKVNVPKTNLEISFEVGGNGTEYEKVFSDVRLCDTVSVYYEELGTNVTAQVYEIEYDSLNERILSVKLGDYEKSFTDQVNDLSADVGNMSGIVINVEANSVKKVVTRYAISISGTVPPPNDSTAWVEGNFLVDISEGQEDALADLVDVDDEGNIQVKYIWEQNKYVLTNGNIRYSPAKVTPLYTLFSISEINKSDISRTDSTITAMTQTNTLLEQYLGVFQDEVDGEAVIREDQSNEDGLAKRFYDVEQKAQLSVERSEVTAIVSEQVTAYGQTVEGELAEINSTIAQAEASLRTDGLHVHQDGSVTESLINSDGLQVIRTTGSDENPIKTIIAQFTNDDSYVDYLKVNRYLTFGSHQTEKFINKDITFDNNVISETSDFEGTGFFLRV